MNLEHDSNSEDIAAYNDLLERYNTLLRNTHDSARDSINYEKLYLTLLDKYNELIYAVQNKYPNETRHQTALRYILEKEKSQQPQQQKVVTPWADPTFQKREWNVTPIVPDQNK